MGVITACLSTDCCLSADSQAQQPVKVRRIGYVAGGAPAISAEFVKGLRDLGYYEGKNIVIEFRTTEGKAGRSFDLAAELIQLKMDHRYRGNWLDLGREKTYQHDTDFDDWRH